MRLFLLYVKFVVVVVVFIVVSIPSMLHLYPTWLFCRLFTSRKTKRRWLGSWPAIWGSKLFWGISWATGKNVIFDIPEALRKNRKNGPFVIVANHQSHLDNILIAAYLKAAGIKDVRWVLKHELRHRAGHVGHACIASESAFITRSGWRQETNRAGLRDNDEIRRCAKSATGDHASMIIYPEGHRYATRDATDRNGLVQQKFHCRGFDIMLEELKFPVLSLTLNWEGVGDGKRLVERAAFGSRRVEITGTLYSHADASRKGWLRKEWCRKHEMLKSGRLQVMATI